MSQGIRVPAGLVLPRNAMPKFHCEVCGLQFYDQGEQIRHIKRCVRRNREAIQELAEQNKRRDPLYDATDWEAMAYQQRRYGSPRQR